MHQICFAVTDDKEEEMNAVLDKMIQQDVKERNNQCAFLRKLKFQIKILRFCEKRKKLFQISPTSPRKVSLPLS